MIKEIIKELKLDVDRMHLSGYLDVLVDTGMLQFKQVSSAKQYKLRSSWISESFSKILP